MSSHNLKVESRENTGTNVAKKLRADGYLPGVVYKKGKETVAVQVAESEFLKTYKAAGTTSVINLTIDGKVYPAIIKDIQRKPVANNITHIDFQEINMNETVKLSIPVHLINRDHIRLQPSILNQMLEHVDVECLPDKIPNTADVDVAEMNYGDAFYVKDLDVSGIEGIHVLADPEALVCSLSEPSRAVEVEEGEEASAAEAPATEGAAAE